MTQAIRNFAKSLEGWLSNAMNNIPQRMIQTKVDKIIAALFLQWQTQWAVLSKRNSILTLMLNFTFSTVSNGRISNLSFVKELKGRNSLNSLKGI